MVGYTLTVMTHLGQQSFLFRFLPASDQRVSGSRWRICAGYPRNCGATSHSSIEFMQLNHSCFRDSSATAYRRLVGTGIAAVSEEASGILSGDTVESGRKRLLQCLDGARRDPAQIGLHLGPGGLDRAEVGAVGRQVAIGKA